MALPRFILLTLELCRAGGKGRRRREGGVPGAKASVAQRGIAFGKSSSRLLAACVAAVTTRRTGARKHPMRRAPCEAALVGQLLPEATAEDEESMEDEEME